MNDAFLVDIMDGFRCLATPLQSKTKINTIVMLVDVSLQITIASFPEEQTTRLL
jgi:hypothetical protein